MLTLAHQRRSFPLITSTHIVAQYSGLAIIAAVSGSGYGNPV